MNSKVYCSECIHYTEIHTGAWSLDTLLMKYCDIKTLPYENWYGKGLDYNKPEKKNKNNDCIDFKKK